MCEQKEEQQESEKEYSGTKARQHALEDARRTLDEQLVSVNDISRKGWRVLQFNGLVATVAVALLPTVFSDEELGLPLIGLFSTAIGLFVISTVVAYRIQHPQNVVNGPGTDVYRHVSDYNYPENQYLREILERYSTGIDTVRETTKNNSDQLQIAVITSAVGLIVLLLFILVSITV